MSRFTKIFREFGMCNVMRVSFICLSNPIIFNISCTCYIKFKSKCVTRTLQLL